ncbi:MAG TPA: hypothetical protein DIV56_05525, partial [Lachnospiraceae bacterium]|nr:hypothetical protein [Lachnospiraceae bacterium]
LLICVNFSGTVLGLLCFVGKIINFPIGHKKSYGRILISRRKVWGIKKLRHRCPGVVYTMKIIESHLGKERK